MTYFYPQGNAYDVIQKDVENKLHNYLKVSKEEIKSIVIVGAYHGHEISRLLNSYTKAHISAFEAYPYHYKVLCSQYESNPRVTCFNWAISDYVGEIDFYELGNGGAGSGSILPFKGHSKGHHFTPKLPITVATTTLDSILPNTKIDLLWVDVQGAELQVLKGANLNNVSSLFLEIHTHNFVQPWDEEAYEGQCYKEDLEDYLVDFELHSIGLDNTSGNGQGNSLWLRKHS